jgi:hypothetical protein
MSRYFEDVRYVGCDCDTRIFPRSIHGPMLYGVRTVRHRFRCGHRVVLEHDLVDGSLSIGVRRSCNDDIDIII